MAKKLQRGNLEVHLIDKMVKLLKIKSAWAVTIKIHLNSHIVPLVIPFSTKLLTQCFSAFVDYVQWRRLRKVSYTQRTIVMKCVLVVSEYLYCIIMKINMET